MGILDIGIWLLVFLATILLLRTYSSSGLGYPAYFWGCLAVYHYLISGLAVGYVVMNGGDSLGYWNLTADTSKEAESWMEHWGYSTFFVQWLNYIPSKILGLHFYTGSLVYSFLSLVGFYVWADLLGPFYQKIKSNHPFLGDMLLLSFFLPSLNFWNGLLGKEALIWFSVFLSLRMAKQGSFLVSFLLAFLAAWIRPIAGVLLIFFLICQLFFSEKFHLKWRIGLGLLGIGGLILGFGLLAYITHLEKISWESIQQFRDAQYAFLDGFEAGSRLSTKGLSLVEMVFIVAFRPFPGEISSIWGWMSGMENLIFLAISMGIVGWIVSEKKDRGAMGDAVLLFALALVYLLAISLSVNVLGIMIRLKTLAMPILIYLGFFGWYLIFRKLSPEKNQRIENS